METRRRILLLAAALMAAAGLCGAQLRRGGFPGVASGRLTQIEGGLVVNEDTLRTARETDSHSKIGRAHV